MARTHTSDKSPLHSASMRGETPQTGLGVCIQLTYEKK
jgi:hypothetical protein